MINPDTITVKEFSSDIDFEQLLDICYMKEEFLSKLCLYFLQEIEKFVNDNEVEYSNNARLRINAPNQFCIIVAMSNPYDEALNITLSIEYSDNGPSVCITWEADPDGAQMNDAEFIAPIIASCREILKKESHSYFPSLQEESEDDFFLSFDVRLNDSLKALLKVISAVEMKMRIDEDIDNELFEEEEDLEFE